MTKGRDKVQRTRSARSAGPLLSPLQTEGLDASSRGWSGATPPDAGARAPQSEGLLVPSDVACRRAALQAAADVRADRGCRCAPPPATEDQAFGLKRLQARANTCFCLLALLLLAACQNDRTVVRYNPFLANVPGAQTDTKPIGEKYKGYEDPSKAPGDKTVIENDDGSVTLIAKSIRHMMSHVALCLQ